MKKPVLPLVQVGLWVMVYLLLLVYTIQKGSDWPYGFVYTTIGIVFYVATVYLHANWLLPRYFYRGRYTQYAILSVALLIGMVGLRMWLEYEFLFVRLNRHQFFGWNFAHGAFDAITILLAFLFGFLLRVALNYLDLLQRQERLRSQQVASELALLKSQVQPHFLFNTLNNIYALAVARSEQTAEVVARLSDIMRYFVEEAPKDRVPLPLEMTFIRNYLELEQIRLRYPLPVQVCVHVEEPAPFIPPMLLIPFVENVFKHGIDKARPDNEAEIKISYQQEQLTFLVKNKVFTTSQGSWGGLANLQRRLELVYPERFEMRVFEQQGYFYASLAITHP
ncbi:sensor histidine kinase [Spirosoma soli]|uniref:Sensor histidine kinase n=1 Tax=Spirosoma soli TaxID=1770529 RepID=A0ABW5MC07_9BACT